MCIHKHYIEFAAKSKTSKIARFMEYLENLPDLKQLEWEVSSREDEQDEELEGKIVPSIVQLVGEDKGNAPEWDSDDEPLVRLTLRKRKVRIINDYEDQAPPATTSEGALVFPTGDEP